VGKVHTCWFHCALHPKLYPQKSNSITYVRKFLLEDYCTARDGIRCNTPPASHPGILYLWTYIISTHFSDMQAYVNEGNTDCKM
jgi:hypothetical protein